MATGPARLRPATREDLAALLSLYDELNPEDGLQAQPLEERFEEVLAHPGLTIFLACDEERPVATASLVVVPNLTRNGRPYALIENVVTASSDRGQGFGGAVVGHAIEAAWSLDCFKVMLLTGRRDPAAHRFYESLGFVQNKTGFQIRRSA